MSTVLRVCNDCQSQINADRENNMLIRHQRSTEAWLHRHMVHGACKCACHGEKETR